MKRSPLAAARRAVTRAATWRPKTRPEEPIDIRRLISPLRYDVLVRAQFFDLVGTLGEDAYDDLDLVLDAAQGTSYQLWWEKVAVARFFPHVAKDPQALAESFRTRVGQSVRLYRSFRANGYDPAHPIMLRGTKAPMRTDSGLTMSGRLHVGDGGHRTALLLSAGLQLEPSTCQVDWRPRPYLLDNTAILLPVLRITTEQYVEFLAAGYGAAPTTDLPTLLRELEGRDPAAAVEARAVSERHLSAVRPASEPA